MSSSFLLSISNSLTHKSHFSATYVLLNVILLVVAETEN